MIKKCLVVLLFATVALTAQAESDMHNVAGVSYRLATAIDIAHSATGRADNAAADLSIVNTSSADAPQWIQWQSSRKSSAVRLMASLKGRYQFGRDGRHHASKSELLGLESDDLLEFSLPGMDAVLIKGLRVGARVSF